MGNSEHEKTPEFARIMCACTNLKMAARVVGRAYDAALAPLNLNATQYAILVNVGRYQPVLQISLAAHLSLERTTLYREVAVLEQKKGLLTTATGKGSAKVLMLTPAGQETLELAKKEWEKVQTGFTGSFGEKRWDDFLTNLDEIRQYFS